MSYNKDPHWIEAKHAGTDINGRPFAKRERVFYFPLSKTIVSGEPAKVAARKFETERQDEEGSR